MDDLKFYLSRLRKGLSKVSPSEQDDIIEEIQTHIEDSLQDPKMGESQEDRMKNTMSELGHPREITNGMNEVHRRYGWPDVILLLAIFPALFVTANIVKLMYHLRVYELPHLINLLMFLGMIIIARKRKSAIPESWHLSWTTAYILFILYGSIKWIYKKRFLMRSRPNFITFEVMPTWLKISLLSIFLIFALSFFTRRIWLSRRDGLSIFFLLFPITFQASISIGEYITETTRSVTTPNTVNSFWVGFFVMIMMAILSITFTFALMMSKQSKRWYSLVIGMMALATNYAIAIVLFSNASPIIFVGQFTLTLLGLFIPLIAALVIEYSHTGRNPLVPIRS